MATVFTGQPHLDRLIVDFLRADEPIIDADHQDPPRWRAYAIGRPSDMHRPQYAQGRCGLVSQAFRDYLTLHSQVAHVSDDPQHGLGEQADPTSPRSWRNPTPDDHGYYDRTREGCGDHCAVLVQAEDGEYLIDFTASQYDYEPLPLVSHRPDREHPWQRLN